MQISKDNKKALLIFIFLFVGISAASRTKRQIIFEDDNNNRLFNTDCQTPDRRPGRCIRLTSCRALFQTNRYRLRRYFCGFEGDEPKVCCPQPRTEVTTRTPPARVTRRTPPPRSSTIRFIDDSRNAGSGSATTVPRIISENKPSENKPSFLPKSCGISLHTKQRVVGGRRADKGSWPWMAVVYVRKSNGMMSPDCGGALVTNRHVITAAHCVVTGRASRPLDPSRVSVRLGAHNLTVRNEPGAVEVGVEAIRRHENFESRTYKNDIAVLKLSRPVTFTNLISPVCLPYDSLRGEDLDQKSAFVIGYGTTAFNGNSSDVLMEAGFYIQSQDVCRRAYESEVKITSVYMCAGMMDGSKDACQGDSGGPLLTIGKNSSYYLVGIVSFGKQCGEPGYPGVYTRVTEFLDWLSRNLRN